MFEYQSIEDLADYLGKRERAHFISTEQMIKSEDRMAAQQEQKQETAQKNQAAAWLCINRSCQEPITDPEQLKQLLEPF